MNTFTVDTIDHHNLFLASPNAYLILDLDLNIAETNDAYVRLVGLERGQLVGRALFEALPPVFEHAAQELLGSFEHVRQLGETHIIPMLRYPVKGRDHSFNDRFWMVRNSPLKSEAGKVVGILNCPIDVTEIVLRDGIASQVSILDAELLGQHHSAQFINTELAKERQHLRHLMQQAPGFLAVGCGPNHIFEIVNTAYYQLVGHRELIGKAVREALPELEGQGFYELLDDVYRSGRPFIGRAMPIVLQAEPGGKLVERYIDFIYQPILDEHANVYGIFVQGHDVTEAHELALQVSYQATHDALTGLLNRREFELRLTRTLNTSQAEEEQNSLLYMDIDQFKVINDMCGHAAGDELLCQISMRLRALLPEECAVARFGGDEFAILLEGFGVEEATKVAEALREAIDELEFVRGQRKFGCSASFGVITFGREIGGIADVLSAADATCFMAKERGRNRVERYRHNDEDLVTRRCEMDWVSRLREALNESRITLYAQHIKPLQCHNSRKTRLEVLIRMIDKDGTVVLPMAFIPAAERYGFMNALDRHVIKETFARVNAIPAEMRDQFHLSINLSGITLSDDKIVAYVQDQLDSNKGVAPANICFEITETAALHNLSSTANRIMELKSLGFRFALDDFGSGMSSLRYLKQLPVDYLKIDGAFIRHIVSSPEDAAMVEAMAKVASVMGIKTVAEYVDSEAVRETLEKMNIDYVQGFHIHIPEPFAEMIEHELL